MKLIKPLLKNTGFIFYFTILLVLIISGINPRDAFTWRMEVLWLFPALFIIAVLWYKGIHFSRLLQTAMFIHALILIYGGHYTYEHVPLGEWMKDAFGYTRNHYDRIGHIAQGFFPAILYRELFVRNNAVNGRFWTEVFVFASCMAFTGLFELIEFAAAHIWGEGADAFLGSQGDIWDAQYDMFMCLIGTIFSILLLSSLHYKILGKIQKEKN
jgi:putative membrane protein